MQICQQSKLLARSVPIFKVLKMEFKDGAYFWLPIRISSVPYELQNLFSTMVLSEIISFEKIFSSCLQYDVNNLGTNFFSHLLLKRLVDSFLITWREIIKGHCWAIVIGDHESTLILQPDFFYTGFVNMTTNIGVYKLIELSLKLILNLFF